VHAPPTVAAVLGVENWARAGAAPPSNAVQSKRQAPKVECGVILIPMLNAR
jgi:hypothetical protein